MTDDGIMAATMRAVQAVVPEVELTPELTRSILIDPLTPITQPDRKEAWLDIQKKLIGDIGLDAYLEGLLHVVEFPTERGYTLKYHLKVEPGDMHVVDGERRLL
jgi:hypothetical protein